MAEISTHSRAAAQPYSLAATPHASRHTPPHASTHHAQQPLHYRGEMQGSYGSPLARAPFRFLPVPCGSFRFLPVPSGSFRFPRTEGAGDKQDQFRLRNFGNRPTFVTRVWQMPQPYIIFGNARHSRFVFWQMPIDRTIFGNYDTETKKSQCDLAQK